MAAVGERGFIHELASGEHFLDLRFDKRVFRILDGYPTLSGFLERVDRLPQIELAPLRRGLQGLPKGVIASADFEKIISEVEDEVWKNKLAQVVTARDEKIAEINAYFDALEALQNGKEIPATDNSIIEAARASFKNNTRNEKYFEAKYGHSQGQDRREYALQACKSHYFQKQGNLIDNG